MAAIYNNTFGESCVTAHTNTVSLHIDEDTGTDSSAATSVGEGVCVCVFQDLIVSSCARVCMCVADVD